MPDLLPFLALFERMLGEDQAVHERLQKMLVLLTLPPVFDAFETIENPQKYLQIEALQIIHFFDVLLDAIPEHGMFFREECPEMLKRVLLRIRVELLVEDQALLKGYQIVVRHEGRDDVNGDVGLHVRV